MKKHVLIIFTLLMAVSLFSGCRKKIMPEPTVPLATITPTKPETRPTMPETTAASVHTEPFAEETTIEATIEDGNGPIPSQNAPTR